MNRLVLLAPANVALLQWVGGAGVTLYEAEA